MGNTEDAPQTQAGKIFARFGNAHRLAVALRAAGAEHSRSTPTVCRWNYPKEKGGTGGYVPTSAVRSVKAAALVAGVLLRKEDWE